MPSAERRLVDLEHEVMSLRRLGKFSLLSLRVRLRLTIYSVLHYVSFSQVRITVFTSLLESVATTQLLSALV